MKKEEIIYSLIQNRSFIESRGAINIGLFGSYSQGSQNDESDIDLLIQFDERKKSFDNFIELTLFLEDILGKDVELITQESIDSDFYNSIKSDLVYAY
jgi:predicted nucleotidyltransferase